jgi:hypothetical protein
MTKSLVLHVVLVSVVFFCSLAAAAQQQGSCQATGKAGSSNPLNKLGDDDAPLLAITACTGEAGSRLLTALRKVYPAKRIRCVVRQGTSKPLDHLNDLESVHQVDFMDTESIAKALHGASAAYLNTPPSLDVLTMRQNMAEACKKVAAVTTTDKEKNDDGLKHIVLMGEAVDINWYGLAKYWDDHKAGEDAIQVRNCDKGVFFAHSSSCYRQSSSSLIILTLKTLLSLRPP